MFFFLWLSFTSAVTDDEERLTGHVRLPHERSLHSDDRALLVELFDVWQNQALLPDYEHDLDRVRCPKQAGRPYELWCDDDGHVTRLSLSSVSLRNVLLPGF